MTQRDKETTGSDSIMEAAAFWYATMNSGAVTKTEKADFAEWINASANHLREYAILDRMNSKIIAYGQYLRHEETVIPFQINQNHTPQNKVQTKRFFKTRIIAALSIAASVAAVAVISGFFYVTDTPTILKPSDSLVYATNIGEGRIIKLVDGSVIQLNTNSEIHVDYTQKERSLSLVRGEGFFQVAKDSARPFVVSVDNTLVKAVGTEFNIRKWDKTIVTVLEGSVQVNPTTDSRAPENNWNATLKAGEQLTVENNDTVAKPIPTSAASPQVVASWRKNRLDFEEETLATVLTEINRYNDTPLVLQSQSLEHLQISGSFNPRDPLLFAQTLQIIAPVDVAVLANEISISAKAQ